MKEIWACPIWGERNLGESALTGLEVLHLEATFYLYPHRLQMYLKANLHYSIL